MARMRIAELRFHLHCVKTRLVMGCIFLTYSICYKRPGKTYIEIQYRIQKNATIHIKATCMQIVVAVDQYFVSTLVKDSMKHVEWKLKLYYCT